MKNVSLNINITPDDAIIWKNDTLYLLDQRLLPETEQYLEIQTLSETAQAITDMVVRGAPAIGVTAAYGVVLGVRALLEEKGEHWKKHLEPELEKLSASRPTAVNLKWSIDQMRFAINGVADNEPYAYVLEQALAIHKQDIAANKLIGEHGASLISENSVVITHCNAGALATGGYGTALGVIHSAYDAGKLVHVYADETRPWMQGARLTAWELNKLGVDFDVLADSAAASVMKTGKVDWVIVGADRIAANGDVANKIGTYPLAITARFHGVKVMVAAPTSTIDLETPSGNLIPIEQRDSLELAFMGNKRVLPESVSAFNPVFDITPAELVDAIVTEKGIISQPNEEKIRNHMNNCS